MARGFSQVEGSIKGSSIRGLISIAAKMGWKIYQMDVKTAFLNGIIQEEIYIEQPHGFEIHDRETCMQAKECPLWAEASS